IKLSYAFYEDSLCYSGYDAAKAITAPTFIVQGAQDEYVPPRQILKLSESLGGPNSVAWLPDADHHFSKQEDFQLMTTLLSNWVSDLLNGPTPPHQLMRKSVLPPTIIIIKPPSII